jgi:Zn-dependent protease/predicted transcriptional regulator
MRPTFRIGHVLGIEIGLHYSWLLTAFLVLLSLAGQFHLTNPQWAPPVIGLAAIAATLLFFASILIHEFSHAAVAKSRGMSVRSITLFALGGVANIEQEPADARSEFWMAIVGPLTSVFIGVAFLGVALITGWQPGAGTPSSPFAAGLLWLGYINIALAIFNMIPGFPLDGGRVLRAIAWRITGSAVRATRIAANAGQFIAVIFILLGMVRLFAGGGLGGLWIAFIGLFLGQAASASYAQTEASAALAGVRVADVMSEDWGTVDGNINLQTFADEFLLRTGRRCFVVTQNGRPLGLVSVSDLKRIERQRWPLTTVSEIVVPLEQVRTVSPETNIKDALGILMRGEVNELPVISNGDLVGVITRGNVVQFLKTRSELKAA